MLSLAVVYSRASSGIHAPLVVVEAHTACGLPIFSIVGLPETAVKESRDRVRSALCNTYFEFPRGRVTVNLGPADLPKDGGRFDLPIALGILAATGQIPRDKLAEFEFTGELALSGELRPIHGVLPFALATRDAKRQLILPMENVSEAGLANNLNIFPARHLSEVCAHLLGNKLLRAHVATPFTASAPPSISADLSDVRGQNRAKRALEIAASGEHSLLFIGPPGTGKTMLASRLPSILPPMTEQEALEAAAVLSITGKAFNHTLWQIRPFRSPHHTASSVALVGGGSPPKPGEISLAHHGVLFLDELPEFNRTVLEALREPLESGHITISRASYQSQFPAKFQFIAAMNPCPCGHLGNLNAHCQCTKDQIQRYQNRISGPLLDRMDIHIEVPSLPKGVFSQTQKNTAETSANVAVRVLNSRQRQYKRQNKSNAHLAGQEIIKFCKVSADDQILLDQAMEHFGLSARAYHRILKVARTIADLADSEIIRTEHLTESLSYRCMDKKRV